jgi:hypothetical protein
MSAFDDDPPHRVICMARFERARGSRRPTTFGAIARWHRSNALDATASEPEPPSGRKIIQLRAIPRLLRGNQDS